MMVILSKHLHLVLQALTKTLFGHQFNCSQELFTPAGVSQNSSIIARAIHLSDLVVGVRIEDERSLALVTVRWRLVRPGRRGRQCGEVPVVR
jgi:hypothetical protein